MLHTTDLASRHGGSSGPIFTRIVIRVTVAVQTLRLRPCDQGRSVVGEGL